MIGQRYSVLLNATLSGNYVIRATMQRECFFVADEYSNPAIESINYEGTAILSYNNATGPPIGVKHNVTNPYNGTCGDMPPSILTPLVPSSPGDVPASNMQYITYGFYEAQQVQRIMINQTAWLPYSNTTTLDVAKSQQWNGSYAFSPSNFVLTIPNNSYAQLIVNSLSNDPHPFHLVKSLSKANVAWSCVLDCGTRLGALQRKHAFEFG
jgi:hypothetical protein